MRPTLLLFAMVPGVVAASTVPYVQVPARLFQPAEQLFAERLPADARLASAGRTLGVLFPRLPDGNALRLVRNGKVHAEVWLPAPKDRPFPRQPWLYLADEGNVAILKVVDYFAVYAGGSLTALVEGDDAHAARVAANKGYLYWAPSPPPSVRWLRKSKEELVLLEEDERPPLLLRSELDGSHVRILLRVDPDRLDEKDPFPPDLALAPAFRSDGKLWLAEPFTGAIMLASAEGRVLRRFSIPFALERPEDDPETRKQGEDELLKKVESMRAAAASDATKRPPERTESGWRWKSPVFAAVSARGRDLVLTLGTHEPPAGTLLLVRDGREDTPICLSLPEPLSDPSPTGRPVITEDAIWFREPFGFIPWQDIDDLLDASENATPLAGTAAGPRNR